MMMFLKRRDTAQTVSATVLLLALGACQSSYAPTECRIADDQMGAFMSLVPEFPLPVRIDSAFGADELARVHAAIDTWNAFGRELIHEDFMQVVSEHETLPDPFDTRCEAQVG